MKITISNSYRCNITVAHLDKLRELFSWAQRSCVIGTQLTEVRQLALEYFPANRVMNEMTEKFYGIKLKPKFINLAKRKIPTHEYLGRLHSWVKEDGSTIGCFPREGVKVCPKQRCSFLIEGFSFPLYSQDSLLWSATADWYADNGDLAREKATRTISEAISTYEKGLAKLINRGRSYLSRSEIDYESLQIVQSLTEKDAPRILRKQREIWKCFRRIVRGAKELK